MAPLDLRDRGVSSLDLPGQPETVPTSRKTSYLYWQQLLFRKGSVVFISPDSVWSPLGCELQTKIKNNWCWEYCTMCLNSQWLQLWNPSVVIVVYLPQPVCLSLCFLLFLPSPSPFASFIPWCDLEWFPCDRRSPQYPRIIFYSNGTQWKKESSFQVLPVSIMTYLCTGVGDMPIPEFSDQSQLLCIRVRDAS